MSINGEQDWKRVELKAQLAEAGQIHCEPVPPMTQAQQLNFAVTRCAELQARMHRKDSLMSEAVMWLSIHQIDRAQEALNRAIIEI